MKNSVRTIVLIFVFATAAGCSAIIAGATSSMADSLSDAIINQSDPETVRQGAPAFLLMMDGFVGNSPKNGSLLQGAAKLYAVYGAVFVDDPLRAKRLTERGFSYGRRALCVQQKSVCDMQELVYDEFISGLNRLKARDAPALFAYTVSWLAYIRTHSSNWGSVADLPKVEASLERIQALDENYESAAVHQYLGILNTLRPAALGGAPELGRSHFEQAVEITNGQDLSIKLEYARSYSRLVYDRELHDRLLVEVVEASPEVPGYTLFNTLAQTEAQALLDSADDYF
ncbi:MAG: TRAP transporter TatT component family protein [Gammaproteobacteria bacterium]|nr:TRAP transporter TatT component family protein [Gammaproteobacteria bacterium]